LETAALAAPRARDDEQGEAHGAADDYASDETSVEFAAVFFRGEAVVASHGLYRKYDCIGCCKCPSRSKPGIKITSIGIFSQFAKRVGFFV
jgi:hypothetical protein